MSKRNSTSKDEASKSRKSLDGSRIENVPNRKSKKCPFKVENFQHSGVVKSGKKKSWKSLSQIAAIERSQVPSGTPTYLSIDAPPPWKPARKYSDISGQLANYTDPETGLYYSTAEEYKQIKRLPTDIVQGYLALRNAPDRV